MGLGTRSGDLPTVSLSRSAKAGLYNRDTTAHVHR